MTSLGHHRPRGQESLSCLVGNRHSANLQNLTLRNHFTAEHLPQVLEESRGWCTELGLEGSEPVWGERGEDRPEPQLHYSIPGLFLPELRGLAWCAVPGLPEAETHLLDSRAGPRRKPEVGNGEEAAKVLGPLRRRPCLGCTPARGQLTRDCSSWCQATPAPCAPLPTPPPLRARPLHTLSLPTALFVPGQEHFHKWLESLERHLTGAAKS